MSAQRREHELRQHFTSEFGLSVTLACSIRRQIFQRMFAFVTCEQRNGRSVNHDADERRQIGWESGEQLDDCTYASGGGAKTITSRTVWS